MSSVTQVFIRTAKCGHDYESPRSQGRIRRFGDCDCAQYTCQQCSKVFSDENAVRKFCSRACRHAHTSSTAMAGCKIGGCDGKHQAKGYCSTHYNEVTYGPGRHKKEIVCTACGKSYITTRHNGRYCSIECRDSERHIWGAGSRDAACRYCGESFKARDDRAKYCSRRCGYRDRNPPKPRRDARGKLRASVEDGDHEGVLAALEARSKKVESGCWNWPTIKRGYPVAIINKSNKFVHRLSLEAHFGEPLGNQPVHHICANTECVNPEHLQLVSHRENIAEMLARNWMVQRITDLESALRDIEPDHPLLNEVSLGLNVAESSI